MRSWLAAVAALVLAVAVPSAVLVGTAGPKPEERLELEHAFDGYVIDFTAACARPADDPSCAEQAYTALRLAEAAATDDAQLRTVLRSHPRTTAEPRGRGPWPFVVVDTDEAGLYARTTGTLDAQRVGIAPNHRIVWADCVAMSGFTPPGVGGTTDAGPTWLKARWRHQDSQAQAESRPGEEQTAWMYRGYLEPLQHNGSLTPCGDRES